MSDFLSQPGRPGLNFADLFARIISPPAPITAPVTTAVPVMPVPDDKAVLMQKRKTLAEQIKNRGRAGTILTSEGTLGAPPEPLGAVLPRPFAAPASASKPPAPGTVAAASSVLGGPPLPGQAPGDLEPRARRAGRGSGILP